MLPIGFTPETLDAEVEEQNREADRSNRYIDQAYETLRREQGEEPRKLEVLDRCQELADKDRPLDQSKSLRSIEYYFKSRHLTSIGRLDEVLTKTGFDFGMRGSTLLRLLVCMNDGPTARLQIFALGVGGNLFYDLIKAGAFTLDWLGDGAFGTGTYFRDLLKSGPTPITPPGGALNGILGAFDGLLEDGQERGRPAYRMRIPRIQLPAERGMTPTEMASADPWGGTAIPGDMSGPVVGTNRSAYGTGSVNGRSPGVVG